MRLVPVVLAGSRMRLEPLGYQHVPELHKAACVDAIWTYLDEPTPQTVEAVQDFVTTALRDQAAGERLPFAIVATEQAIVVGSTSYINVRPVDRGLEIGWTWLNPDHWGTGVNREAKYLLLRHAFEDQAAIRVAIKTDARNIRSQRAIEALGAVKEGTWRNHRILSTGEYRHSVYYSITDEEWPQVKQRLRTVLGKYPPCPRCPPTVVDQRKRS